MELLKSELESDFWSKLKKRRKVKIIIKKKNRRKEKKANILQHDPPTKAISSVKEIKPLTEIRTIYNIQRSQEFRT